MAALTPIRLLRDFIKTRWLALTGLLMLAIATLSLIPLPELPPTPGSDKTHHFIAYAALMFPTALRRPRHWLWIGLAFVAFSGVIELVQPLANRHMEAADLLANSIGVLCGILAARLADTLGGKP